MTRFARAKGSKSSNSRNAEESTPWNVLKSQMQEKSSSPQAQHLLKDLKSSLKPSAGNEVVWADFGNSQSKGKQQKKRKIDSSEEFSSAKIPKVHAVEESQKGKEKRQQLKKKFKRSNLEECSSTNNLEQKPEVELKKTKADKKEMPSKVEKREKKNNSPKKARVESEFNVKNKEISKGGKRRQNESNLAGGKEFSKKQEYSRRKPYIESSIITINGIDISITKFDGFDVKSEDAVRLKDLRKKMIQQGIPRPQVQQAIKLERRKAEKALAREKKKVCFNCRKAGHLLSECPELGNSAASNWDSGSTGLCYKCGSTEHTHFECKVEKKREYRFAKCFICQEVGHISSQCPDNPKGLYPQGGCCKVCGEVTHLKKDCPKLTEERTENAITLDTFSGSQAIEVLDKPSSTSAIAGPPKKNKIIKF